MYVQERISLLREGDTSSAFADLINQRAEIRAEINRLSLEDQVLTSRFNSVASDALVALCDCVGDIASFVGKCTLSIRVNPDHLVETLPDSMCYRIDPTAGDDCKEHRSLAGMPGFAFGHRNWLHVCSGTPLQLIENHLAIRQATAVISQNAPRVAARISVLRHGEEGYYSDILAVYTYRSSSTGVFKPGSWTQFDSQIGEIGDDLIVDKIGPNFPGAEELITFVDALGVALSSKDGADAYRD